MKLCNFDEFKEKVYTVRQYFKQNNYKDEKIALQKYVEYCNSHNKSFYSKIASNWFENLEKDLNIEHCYYAPKTKEFGLYSNYLKRYVSIDFRNDLGIRQIKIKNYTRCWIYSYCCLGK